MVRAERDLAYVRTMMVEAVRHGLIKGRLQFLTHVDNREVTRKDFLSALVTLVETSKDELCQNQQTTSSGETTKQLVGSAEESES
jgi:hypothetical protein